MNGPSEKKYDEDYVRISDLTIKDPEGDDCFETLEEAVEVLLKTLPMQDRFVIDQIIMNGLRSSYVCRMVGKCKSWYLSYQNRGLRMLRHPQRARYLDPSIYRGMR